MVLLYFKNQYNSHSQQSGDSNVQKNVLFELHVQKVQVFNFILVDDPNQHEEADVKAEDIFVINVFIVQKNWRC